MTQDIHWLTPAPSPDPDRELLAARLAALSRKAFERDAQEPNRKVVSNVQWRREAEAAAIIVMERYLAKCHVTSWGQAYDLSDPGRRREAAEWFVQQMAEAKLL